MVIKEGNLSYTQTIFVEDSKAGISCNVVEEAEKINGEPVVYKASKELEVEDEEKRVRNRGDEGVNNQRTKQLFNPDRPPKILKQGEMSNKENQPKQEKLWNSLRGTINVEVQVYGRYTVCNKEQCSTRDLVKESEEVRSL